MANRLLILKPSVPKRWLFFVGASVWGFAAYRVLLLAIRFVPEAPFPQWEVIILGIAGLAVFFNFVFLRVSRKYIRRIACLRQQNPCIFAFFGWKSYLLIALMSSMGILFARFHLLPLFLQGIFYIALGGSLLLSALMFLNAGIIYDGNIPGDCGKED
ncbi:MAG: hypothetical protein IPN08_06340 [Bacteroidales bacterium]|nr:hypothetical protein [Bacteroidales bacterium]MBK9356996.1 hypothetical protein [Bacteroidales bacterium]